MIKNSSLWTIFLFAALFSFLFYKEAIGINLLIFELAVIAFLLFVQKIKFKNPTSFIVLLGTLISAIIVTVNYSTISIVVNILSFFILTGVVIYPSAKSLITSFNLAVSNIFQSFGNFSSAVKTVGIKPLRLKQVWKVFKIILVPLFIILLFYFLYKTANPLFDKMSNKVFSTLTTYFTRFFHKVNFALIGNYVFGFILSVILIFHARNEYLIQSDYESDDLLYRKRKVFKSRSKVTGLKNELKAGIFLLIILNVLILIVNSIDVYWVWFNFEWNGTYLKQFVHEGTYLLIVSVLISIAICLYFFRGNLNFYKRNGTIKVLSYIWLAQNSIMVISVALRNFRYIEYYALAYKRIGVIFFLIATLYGIYTVIKKIWQKHSTFYLIRKNFLAFYVIFIVLTIPNWDAIIARYNFKHYEMSFVHYDYLVSLSDRALPDLNKSFSELQHIHKIQLNLFPFIDNTMYYETYFDLIQDRKLEFKNKWIDKSWKSWNLAESRAYDKLCED